MSIFLKDQAEAYRHETFRCAQCSRDFKARVITWVDVSRMPQIKKTILQQEFNIIQCPYCGRPHFAEVPFFYEDFEEGMLVAVFPETPANRDAVEAELRERFGYYPVLECFYDMAQIWLLVYLQNHYREKRNSRSLPMTGRRRDQTFELLRFLKEDPLMAVIKDNLGDIFSGASEDGENLAAVLGQAVYRSEGLHPWPLDRRCICGADISQTFKCCGRRLDFDNHELLSSRRNIGCPACGRTFVHAACGKCSRTYTWELGIVESFEGGEDLEHLFSRVRGPFHHSAGGRM